MKLGEQYVEKVEMMMNDDGDGDKNEDEDDGRAEHVHVVSDSKGRKIRSPPPSSRQRIHNRRGNEQADGQSNGDLHQVRRH